MRSTIFDIDTKLLLDAMKYYESIGYHPIEAPMLVDDDIIKLTLPPDRLSEKHMGLNYVGSAEQSFYQLLKDKGYLYPGSYMLVTPCRRDEVPSISHLRIFLKIELISLEKTREEVLKDVQLFYETRLKIPTETVPTIDGYDININSIEVGSFGNRFINNGWITYGTGLALPRISYALNNTIEQE